MVIHCKRVYEPLAPEDGTRVLVDRLWPRGVSEKRLAALWWPELAPSPPLRKWYNHDPQRWEEFRAGTWRSWLPAGKRLKSFWRWRKKAPSRCFPPPAKSNAVPRRCSGSTCLTWAKRWGKRKA